MSRCRAESFYLSPRDKRSFAHWRVHARLDGKLVEITHRGDLAALCAEEQWDHLVILTAREGGAQETHWLDERVIEGHLPEPGTGLEAWQQQQERPAPASAEVLAEVSSAIAAEVRSGARRRGRRGAGRSSARSRTLGGAAADTPTLQALRVHPVICDLGDAFARRGYTLYLVGGTVRDAFADQLGDDLDFTTDAPPEIVKQIVGSLGSIWDANGEQYGTVGVDVRGFKVEITQHRREVYTADSRNPVVELGGTLLEDLGRRDFTYNASAMACHTPSKEVVDPYGGAGAFVTGVIDVPGDDPLSTMSEDPLRCVRAARFSAKFDHVIADRLQDAIRDPEVISRLERLISTERTTAELQKMLAAGGETTARFLDTCAELGIQRAVLKEIPAPAARTAALGALGAHVTPEVVLATLVAGQSQASTKLAALKLKSQQIKEVCEIAEVTEALAGLGDATPDARVRRVRALALDHDDDTLGAALQSLAALEPTRLAGAESVVAQVQREEPNVRGGVPVTGADALALGLQGPVVGRGLRAVREALIADPGLSATAAREILAAVGANAPAGRR